MELFVYKRIGFTGRGMFVNDLITTQEDREIWKNK